MTSVFTPFAEALTTLGEPVDGRRFKVGDKVVDRDGFRGKVVKVTEWEGSIWYDVDFGNGNVGVRYNDDLELE